MTQTTYYEFSKPEGTDLVNPLVDTNPNWDALDADLHEFNERSISNATEVVALGVHTISRLDTTAKFLKWIATANFTSGETFTVDGLPVAATTPAGAALATGAYVTGSVVLACLNADNTAMTIYVSGTTVASDSERLGGELPSYYGTASDVSNNATDIGNLQNQVGNTSIVGIGDGTCTGAIDYLNGLIEGGALMPELDIDNAVEIDATSVTTAKIGQIMGVIGGAAANIIYADSLTIAASDANRASSVCVPFIPAGSVITRSGAHGSGNHLYFIPYKD